MSPKTLTDYLETSAARHPERVAVVDRGADTLTYAELNSQADALSGFLWSQGIRRGDRVGVVLPKSAQAVVSLFAIMKTGAAYVPIDCSAPAERGRRILVDCETSAVFVGAQSHHFIPDKEELRDLRAIVSVGDSGTSSISLPRRSAVARRRVIRYEDALSAGGPRRPATPEGSDLAYIIFTSGSTGIPKGVMITHSNAVSFVEWCSSEFAVTEADRFTSHAPFHFDPSVIDLYVSAKVAASVYLVPEEVGRHPGELARFIARHRLTFWNSTPSVLMMLVQHSDMATMRAWSPKIVVFGGEVFPLRYLRELQQRWSSAAYFNLYGPTETTTACTFARIPPAIPVTRTTPYPIGFPCSHCRALLLDDNGENVAAGQEGLLHISGPSVFSGYWNRPAETAAAIHLRDGVRWYNTGDLARWDPSEGFSYIGRKDRMVKRHGFRIELAEIERALYEHPAIQAAGAVAVAGPDSSTDIVAFVSCEASAPSIIELKTFCRSHLPSYMVPDRFVFQSLLPKTSTDKVDYQALARELTHAVIADR